MDKDAVIRDKRLIIRSLKKQRDSVVTALSQTVSETSVQTIKSYLELWQEELLKLEEVDKKLFTFLDYTKATTEEAIEKIESEVTSILDYYKHEFGLYRGKFNAVNNKLESEKRKSTALSRESLNASFQVGSNPLSKLPDIKVPTFDGNVQNYTNWQALFDAVVDSNELLTDVHKLYYLKLAMIGDAKDLLTDYPLTENMYAHAYSHVKKRFFNKRAIIAQNFCELLDFPKIEPSMLCKSIDQLEKIQRSLKTCDIDTAKMSPLFAFIVVRKLPQQVRIDWENSVTNYSTYPTFEPLIAFLSNRCFTYETMDIGENSVKKTSPQKPKEADKKEKTPKAEKTSLATVKNSKRAGYVPKCIDCNEEHRLIQCPNFDKKTISERFDFVIAHKLCQNCLRPNHVADSCRASNCRVCNEKHSTKLHRDKVNPPSTPSTSTESSKTTLATISSQKCTNAPTLLPCAVVRVKIAENRNVLARVLIDGCSQANLVTESFVRRHRLCKTSAYSNIAGVGSMISSSHAVELTVVSQYNDYAITFTADVIGRLPYEMTSDKVQVIAQLDSSLKLADQGVKSTDVDILIGVEFSNRILSGQKKFVGETCFENSEFGWIVSGPIQHAKLPLKCCYLSVAVQDVLSQFWEVEQVNPSKKSLSEFEQIEAHFESTHTRLADGRFEIRLPFKSSTQRLANTYAQARAALLRCERESDASIRAQYVDFMQEYVDLGHMVPVDSNANPVGRYYIPHLPVLRPDSSTTQLRVVFNASACNNTGVSLNENLLNGSEIQPPLFDILINHRKYPIAFSADVSKMYRQISMNKLDRCWQTILWRFDLKGPILLWELTTLTYGERPASYIAKKCLKKIAEEVRALANNTSDPELKQLLLDVADAIEYEFVMDDLLSGAYTVEEAIAKQAKIHSTLLGAKFPLRKYVSNSPEFIEALDPTLVEKLRTVEFSSSRVAKILGLQWNPTDDKYQVISKVVDISAVIITKRVVSSLTASVYDPLGIVGPVLIRGKILLQDLWREELDWDQPVSTQLASDFKTYYQGLTNLALVQIPRPYPRGKIEIIGFCDASKEAYGAVLYARSSELSSSITLICAKSKVAPIKALTVPRLELVGATLLTALVTRITSILKMDPASCKVYCDSTIALGWIKGQASKYETFVRNRIEYITSILPAENWSYVKSAENPADLLTRGLTPTQLAANSLWKSGPEWLQHPNLPDEHIELPSDLPEQRKSQNVKTTLAVAVNEELISTYSSLDKLVRVVRLVKTFINRLRKKVDSTTQQAMDAIYRASQAVWFPQEVKDLQDKKPVSSKSHLASLEPFIDDNGVLRCGGRLANANLPYAVKHPVILHCKSKLAKLLVRHAHEAYCHASHSFVLGYMQRKYYLIHGAVKLIRSILKRCVYCARMNAKTVKQLMGDLPKSRTEIARPFTNCGVDYAGPFTIRCNNHRSPKHLKHYAAFFVCMVTRAVHIESVADLSTKSFMAALHRFVARRGIPNTIWSDNGTNFTGAKNLIDKMPATLNIDWKLIPPRSPHHGGIWESAVKVGKKHLLSVSKGSVLNEDQFKTVLTSIEAIMNSRPLYRRKVEADYDTIDIITPGHFLIQSDLLTPDQPVPDKVSLFEMHNAQRQLINQFWSTWKKSYLTLLQRKSKWTADMPNLKPGDIVIIKEECSPLSWPLAQVVAVLPDRKGRVRVVKLRAKGSEFTRSVQQVVLIPVEEDSPN